MTLIKEILSCITRGEYSTAYDLVEQAASEKTLTKKNIDIFTSSKWYLEEENKFKFFKSNGESSHSLENIVNNNNLIHCFSISYCVMLMANEIEVTIKTIASLIEQSSEYDSIYILLNGFTDKSLLSRLIKHARVFCFSCEGNLGVAGGRNYLYERVFETNDNPDYIVNLDNDVALPQDFCLNVRSIASKAFNEENIGIIGAVILDYKKQLVKNFIQKNCIQYKSYMNASIDGYYTDDLRHYLKATKDNLYWHCGMHSNYRSVYLDQLENTIPHSEILFLANSPNLDFTNKNSWIEISNPAGCFQLFKASLLKKYGHLIDEFAPYFWEDSEFSSRLIKHGLTNYTSTNILLCHGTDNRHKSRKQGNEILRNSTNEYRARSIYQHYVANSDPTTIFDDLTHRSLRDSNNKSDQAKILARQIGVFKGLAQLGSIPLEFSKQEDSSSVIKKLRTLTASQIAINDAIDSSSNNNYHKNKPSLVEMATDLKRFFDIHNGEECILLCNGPSLKNTNLGALKALNIPIFASNSSYILANALDFSPTYFVCEDNHVIMDNLQEISDLRGCHKFIPDKYFEHVGRLEKLHYMPTNWDAYFKSKSSFENPGFSEDISKIIYVGQTVTYLMLQIAYFMGFKAVHIVGLDFSYKIPKGSDIIENSIDHSDDDPNHFHKDYFGKGKQWHFPKLDSCLQSYIKANKCYLDKNRIIYNCTVNSKLNAFELSHYIKGINVRSALSSNTELPTYLDQYFDYALSIGKCVDKFHCTELHTEWEAFISDTVYIYYSCNKNFYQVDSANTLSYYPFLSDFDSTVNVSYVYLNLPDDLLKLDFKIYGENNLYALFLDKDNTCSNSINLLLKALAAECTNFCMVKINHRIYFKILSS